VLVGHSYGGEVITNAAAGEDVLLMRLSGSDPSASRRTSAAVVTDHDSRVIARRQVRARAWELGELLDWAVARASEAGFASVTVACEPTGHRWRVLDQLAAGRGLVLVCVRPLLGLPGPGG